jgi:hypothetical protein
MSPTKRYNKSSVKIYFILFFFYFIFEKLFHQDKKIISSRIIVHLNKEKAFDHGFTKVKESESLDNIIGPLRKDITNRV